MGSNWSRQYTDSTVTDYTSAKLYLGAKDSRKLRGKATKLVRTGVYLAVQYHDTKIVEYHPDGKILLNSGGFRTLHTRYKINEFLPKTWRVWQDKGLWRVTYQKANEIGSGKAKSYLFADGMILYPSGYVAGAKRYTPDNCKPELRLRAQIRKYAADYTQALLSGKIGLPSTGDCFGCSMFEANAAPLQNLDHWRTHMLEGVYTPQLALKAIETYGSPFNLQGVRNLMQNRGVARFWGTQYVQRDLPKMIRRYLYLKFGTASSN